MLVLSAAASGQGAPTGLQVDSTTTSTVTLTWTAPVGGTAPTAYNVYRCGEPCTLSAASDWIAWVDQSGGTDLDVTDTNDDSDPAEAGGTSPVAAGTTYRYVVASAPGGAWSNQITVTTPQAVTHPGAPTGLEVVSTTTSTVELSWTAPADDGNGAIAAYNVYRCDEPCALSTADHWIAWVTVGTAFTDTREDTGPEAGGTSPVAPAATYRYAVAAYRGSEGPLSNQVTATTPPATRPGAPTDLKIVTSSASGITIGWTAPADDGGGPPEAYNVYRCAAPCALDGNDWIAWVTAGTSHEDTGVTAGAAYRYAVAAYRDLEGAWSTEIVAVARAPAVPRAPAGLWVADTSNTSITLRWSALDDGGGTPEAYNVYRCEQVPGESPCAPAWIAWVTAGTSFRDTRDDSTPAEAGGASPVVRGKTYRYEVAAYRTGLAGDRSAQVTAKAETFLSVPSAPADFAARGSGKTVALSWRGPWWGGTSHIDSHAYTLYRGEGDSCEELSEYNTDIPPSATYWEDTGVTAGQSYCYRLTASNLFGDGPSSDTQTVTAVDPGAPGDLEVVKGNTGIIGLGWTAPPEDGGGALDGYDVYRCEQTGDDACVPTYIAWVVGREHYEDRGLATGVTYRYSVDAVRANGVSEKSNEVTFNLGAAAVVRPGTWELMPVTVVDALGTTIEIISISADAGTPAGTLFELPPVDASLNLVGVYVTSENAQDSSPGAPDGLVHAIDTVLRIELDKRGIGSIGELPSPATVCIPLSGVAGGVDRGSAAFYRTAADGQSWVPLEAVHRPGMVCGAIRQFTRFAVFGRMAEETPDPDPETPAAAAGPRFAEDAGIGDLVFTAGEAMEPIALPRAMGGDIDETLNGGELSDYSFDPVDLPPGLEFDRFTRVMRGTPTQALEKTDYTYWVHDDDEDNSRADSDSLGFTITILAAGGDAPQLLSQADRALLEDVSASMARSMLSSAVPTIGDRFSASNGSRFALAGRQLTLGELAERFPGDIDRATAPPGNAGFPSAPGGVDGTSRAGMDGASLATHRIGERRYIDALSGVPGGDGVAGHQVLGGDRLLLGTSFAARLAGDLENTRQWMVWGRSDIQSFQSGSADGGSYSGDLRTGYLGLDGRTGDRALFGVALSHSLGQAEYAGSDSAGTMRMEFTTVLPYARFTPDRRSEAWIVLGAGRGERQTLVGDRLHESGALAPKLGALGGRRTFESGIAGIDWEIRGDVEYMSLESVHDAEISASRARLGLAGSSTLRFGSDAIARPFLELGVRYDGGAGRHTGVGVEVVAGAVFRHSRSGFWLQARGRTLLLHAAADYRESGFSLTAGLQPSADGTGLSVLVSPRWGGQAESSNAIWGEYGLNPAHRGIAMTQDDRSIRSEVAWGFLAPHSGAMIQPFGEMQASDGYHRRARLGARYRHMTNDRQLELELSSGIAAADSVERPDPLDAAGWQYDLLLRGNLRF